MYLNIIYQLEFLLFTVYNPSSRKKRQELSRPGPQSPVRDWLRQVPHLPGQGGDWTVSEEHEDTSENNKSEA